MAVERVIIIKGDTKQAQKSFEQLGDTIEEQKKITIEFEKELLDLERQLKKTASLPQQRKIRKEIEKRKDAIKDNRLALKELNFERSKIKGAAAQTKANKGLNKSYFDSKESLTDVNRLTAEFALKIKAARNIILGGVQAVVKFVRGLSGLKTALLATGVGALVVALGLVIEFWDEILDFIKGTNKALEEQIKLNEDNIKTLENQTKILEAEEKLLEAQGKSTKEIREERQKLLKLQITETELLATNLELRLKEKQLDAVKLSFLQQAANIAKQAVGIAPDLVPEITEKEKKAIQEIAQAATDARVSVLDLKTEIIDLNKSKEDKEFDKKLKRLEAQEAQELQKRQEKLDKEFEQDEKQNIKNQEALRDTREEEEKIEISAETDRVNREFKAAKERIKIEKIVADTKQKIREAEVNNIAKGFALIGKLAGKNKALQALAIIGENAVGVAKIIINTQAANAAATLKYALLPGGIALAAAERKINNISAGIGIATSVAATAQALSDLGQGGSVKGAAVPEGGGQAVEQIAPEFNIVGASAANQLAASIADQPPVKTFVVSKDVTSQQELDRNIVSTATFG